MEIKLFLSEDGLDSHDKAEEVARIIRGNISNVEHLSYSCAIRKDLSGYSSYRADYEIHLSNYSNCKIDDLLSQIKDIFDN
jgi:hypothetical protein